MIKYDLDMIKEVRQILGRLIVGEIYITHVYDRDLPARHDTRAWLLSIRTSGGYKLTFHMEGRNIHNCVECVEPDGRRLIHGPYAVLDGMPIETIRDLEVVVLTAYDQVSPTQ